MEHFKLVKKELINAVEQLNEETVLKLSEEALAAGMEPFDLLEVVKEGMLGVGRLYEQKVYFIADLIMAGIIFKEVLELDKMTEQFHSNNSRKVGTVVVGTVSGDLHDIGKDIFRGMMEANCFEVIDLGVDVPKELFVKKVMEYKPDILGLAGVLTCTTDAMKDVVYALKEAGIRHRVKVIVGGKHLTADACRYIGADGYANDASDGVKLCVNWLPKEGRK
ncbi:MAG: cobalamin-binding protein [Firmicutes bacterium]|jgi:methanogenic corrinoid protein MtbC1|nr:cobalamin-binding protein [Bacillota bacterium]